jgi:hypothetical protein
MHQVICNSCASVVDLAKHSFQATVVGTEPERTPFVLTKANGTEGPFVLFERAKDYQAQAFEISAFSTQLHPGLACRTAVSKARATASVRTAR